jgi:hypothetical protein
MLALSLPGESRTIMRVAGSVKDTLNNTVVARVEGELNGVSNGSGDGGGIEGELASFTNGDRVRSGSGKASQGKDGSGTHVDIGLSLKRKAEYEQV